jgi:hypothetical protein
VESNHRRRGYEPRAQEQKQLNSQENTEPGPIIGANKAERKRIYRSGLAKMKAGITKLGSRAIDGRYRVSRALVQWRKDLINDLGGEGNISAQQRTLVELASTSKLLLGSIDAWILSQPTLFTRQKTVLPAVLQRQAIANGLMRCRKELGLKRVLPEPKNLQDYMREIEEEEVKAANSNSNGTAGSDSKPNELEPSNDQVADVGADDEDRDSSKQPT